jgi:predicted permease
MREFWRRVWFLLNRSRLERELREEMEAHRDMMGDGAAGFGNSLRLREEAHDEWGWAWFDRLTQDLGFGCRLLWRAPAFTMTAIAVLAVGIGLNLAAFQMVDRLAVSWLPVRSPQTLVNLHRRTPESVTTTFSYPAFDFYRTHSSSITAGMAVVSGSVSLGDDQAGHIAAAFVTGNYFPELGAQPLAGRLLDESDDAPDADAVIVLGERWWKTALGADPSAIGRPIRVNGHQFTLVGVLPEDFVGLAGQSTAVWMPIAHHRFAFRGSTLLQDWNADPVQFFARLRDGVTPPAAEAELKSAVNSLRAMRPESARQEEWLALHAAGRYVSFEEAAPAFALISCLVGLVLVAACMNLGLLVLARTFAREREFAIRLSVGATRGRIVRQLLTEHLLLGALGAAVGCVVALQTTGAALTFSGAPAGLVPEFNVRTFIAATLLAVVSAIVFGFAPAWQVLRPLAARRLRLRSVLVGVQVAAASALLILSGLLVRGVTRVVRVPLGFDYQQAVVVDPDLASHGMSVAAAQAYWRSVDTRVREIPGVSNIALTSLAPLGNRVAINRERTVFYHVTAEYFDTLSIELKRGRLFNPGESAVTLVSESLARRRWPDEDPLGKPYGAATVIGVVADARTVKVSDSAASESYFPIEAEHLPGAVLVVRAGGSPHQIVPTLRSVLRDIDSRMLPSVVPLADALQAKLEDHRRFAVVTSALGACALLLAVTGLGGFVAFAVSQRLREIGVRLALGARPSHIVRAIGRQFTAPVVCGALAGSALAAAAGMVLSSELFGVSSIDPFAHGGAFLFFALVAAAAALPSLRRAIRVDPIQTLRHE